MELVRLIVRKSSSGTRFTYLLEYKDREGKRRRISLGHADKRRAERQRKQKENELKMGFVEPGSMRLSVFVDDSLQRTGSQIRESTRREYRAAMEDFIKVVGDRDFRSITMEDGEFYRQQCLDRGNRPATVVKKMTGVKRFFRLGVKRHQLYENPFAEIDMPDCPDDEINTYSDAECQRILKVAREFTPDRKDDQRLRWDLLLLVALCTAFRRGELLNCIWSDIDSEKQTIRVAPKNETHETWKWLIKNNHRRTLPLTEELTQMLAEHKVRQPEGYPYVFVPPARYDFIQTQLRAKGLWTYTDSRLKVINNFTRDFNAILKQAGVKHGEFNDLRRTAICNWFAEGLTEYEVMKLAGHADFKTTHKYYLKVHDGMDRAREASTKVMRRNLAHFGTRPFSAPQKQEGPTTVNDCQPSTYSNGQDWS